MFINIMITTTNPTQNIKIKKPSLEKIQLIHHKKRRETYFVETESVLQQRSIPVKVAKDFESGKVTDEAVRDVSKPLEGVNVANEHSGIVQLDDEPLEVVKFVVEPSEIVKVIVEPLEAIEFCQGFYAYSVKVF